MYRPAADVQPIDVADAIRIGDEKQAGRRPTIEDSRASRFDRGERPDGAGRNIEDSELGGAECQRRRSVENRSVTNALRPSGDHTGCRSEK